MISEYTCAHSFADYDAVSFKLELSDSETNLRRFRLPLHVALAISPLTLLLDVDFGSRETDRGALVKVWSGMSAVDVILKKVQVWAYLSDERPPQLKTVEEHLWRFIFGVAGSKIQFLAALKTTLESMASVDYATMHESGMKWFADTCKYSAFRTSFCAQFQADVPISNGTGTDNHDATSSAPQPPDSNDTGIASSSQTQHPQTTPVSSITALAEGAGYAGSVPEIQPSGPVVNKGPDLKKTTSQGKRTPGRKKNKLSQSRFSEQESHSVADILSRKWVDVDDLMSVRTPPNYPSARTNQTRTG